jgi:hypothetical protein
LYKVLEKLRLKFVDFLIVSKFVGIDGLACTRRRMTMATLVTAKEPLAICNIPVKSNVNKGQIMCDRIW